MEKERGSLDSKAGWVLVHVLRMETLGGPISLVGKGT